MGAHGWVAGIASHGSVSLSRGWLISVEAPRNPGHLSSIQLDAVVNTRTKITLEIITFDTIMVIIIHVYCIGLIIHFLLKYSFFL